MSSPAKPITIHGKGGPNPPKVIMLARELGIPHEVVPVQFPDLKKPEFLAINPNGRMPAIHDPNTDITVWESGAIVEYLIERYDQEQKLSFAPLSAEAAHARQWLFFQTTGQGPYYGQAVWFMRYHPEKVPSAVERYCNEIKRVSGVLEGHLKQQKQGQDGDGPWLVGGKMSYADLAFVPWQFFADKLLSKEQYDEDEFPTVKTWMGNMLARKAVIETMQNAMS